MFEKIKLKNLVDLRAGIGFPNKYQGNKNSNIPFYKVGDISREFQKCNFYINNADNYITAEILAELKGKLFDEGTIIFAKVGEALKLNRRIILTQKAMIDNNIFGIKSNNPCLNNKYLFYFLLQYDLGNICKTGAVPSVNQSDIYSISIPLPPTLEEQQEIVDVLDAASEIIRLRTACIESARSLIPALFQEMFGDVVDNKTMSPIYNLGDVADFVRGPFGGSLKKEIFVKEGYWVYEQYHAINNDFSKARYFIDDKKFNEMKRFEVYPGDILISCSGTMGKIAIVPDDYHKGIINQALLKLSVHNDVLNNIFLKYLLLSEYYQNKYFRNQPGAAIQNVQSVSVLKNIKIILPTIQQQKNFVDKVQEIESYIKSQQAELENAKTMFQSLLHYAFMGKLTENITFEVKNE